MTRQASKPSGGFSLVEVTLSLGIIAFALVAVMGLLGVGVNASRESVDETVMGLIAQDISNRVREELASVGPPADSSGAAIPSATSDFRWNATAFTNRPGYAMVANTILPNDPPTGGPGITANAYYTHEGVFVRETIPGAEMDNYYKAAIYVNPLPLTSGLPTTVSYTSLNLPPTYSPPNVNPPTVDYPMLAVTVNVGWPVQPVQDGLVIGPAGNKGNRNAAKSTFTFFMSKP